MTLETLSTVFYVLAGLWITGWLAPVVWAVFRRPKWRRPHEP